MTVSNITKIILNINNSSYKKKGNKYSIAVLTVMVVSKL